MPIPNPNDLVPFDSSWAAALHELSPEIHPVDRDAVLIWFQFYPLGLLEVTSFAGRQEGIEEFYQLQGYFGAGEVADSSHSFLYSHRFWSAAKQAVTSVPLHGSSRLVALIREVAAKMDAPAGLGLPIAAIALMTLRQAGPEFLSTAVAPPKDKRTPEQVLRDRAKDAKAGFFGKKVPRVIFNEADSEAWFPIIPTQHLTAAAELDKRPHHEKDRRCYIGNGPIPVDCRSGTCGTCWVGVLGGNDKLDPVETYERKRMEYFGYWESPFHQADQPRPLIRLACQTVAHGSCSIVIPPWNGVWGKSRREAWARRSSAAPTA
jgi:ferredoxin